MKKFKITIDYIILFIAFLLNTFLTSKIAMFIAFLIMIFSGVKEASIQMCFYFSFLAGIFPYIIGLIISFFINRSKFKYILSFIILLHLLESLIFAFMIYPYF